MWLSLDLSRSFHHYSQHMSLADVNSECLAKAMACYLAEICVEGYCSNRDQAVAETCKTALMMDNILLLLPGLWSLLLLQQPPRPLHRQVLVHYPN